MNHILWVDDGQKSESRIPGNRKKMVNNDTGITNVFGEYSDYVKRCKSFKAAVELICSDKFSKYDCVVLDIDLTVGDQTIPRDLLNQNGINIDAGKNIDELDDNELLKNGGYYLYLLLISRGFPFKRILIRTAHANDTEAQAQKFINASIKIPKIFNRSDEINDEEEFIDALNGMYGQDKRAIENKYYLLRDIVLNACAECKNKLKKSNKSEEANIVYNDLVYDDEKKLLPETLTIMFDNVSVQFPWQIPSNKSQIYKNVLRFLVEPFEANFKRYNYNESKKNKNPDKNKNTYEDQVFYWKFAKLLRNWITHNILRNDTLDDNTFLMLFLTSLRALFGNWYDEDNILDYENKIFEFIRKNECNPLNNEGEKFVFLPDDITTAKNIEKNFMDLYTLFNKYDCHEFMLSTSYYEMLVKLGNIKGFEGKYNQLLKLVCLYPLEESETKKGEEETKASISIERNSSGYFYIKWDINDDVIKKILGRNLLDNEFLKKLRRVSIDVINSI